MVKPHQHTCSKCFSPSSSSVSCITVLGLLIGASTLDEKGRGLFIAIGISTGFCGGNWTEGEGADIVVNREQQILGVFLNVKISLVWKKANLCKLEASDPTCSKRCRNVFHGYWLQNDIGQRDMQGSFGGLWWDLQRWWWLLFSRPLRLFCSIILALGQRLSRTLGFWGWRNDGWHNRWGFFW